MTSLNEYVAYVDRGYVGEWSGKPAQYHCLKLIVVKHTEATKRFPPLPRHWLDERSFGCAARFSG